MRLKLERLPDALSADCGQPVALAIPRVDQWVASLGFSSKVLISTRFDHLVCDRAAALPGGTRRPTPADDRAGSDHATCTPSGDVPTSRATAWLVLALGTGEHDPVPQGQGLRGPGRRAHRSSVCALLIAEHQLCFGLPRSAMVASIVADDGEKREEQNRNSYIPKNLWVRTLGDC